jgi:hypothetical protein
MKAPLVADWVLRFVLCLLAASVTASVRAADAPVDGPEIITTSPAIFAGVKQKLASGDTSLRPALDELVSEAQRALKTAPASVMDKPGPWPGGDMHDYVSYAPYFWPNPDTADHLPYVRHDGKRNREQMARGDAPRFEKMMGAIDTLGLAWGITGREEFADHASKLLRAWFLDPATKMNPNFSHAQAVLGENAGRGTGLIEFGSMAHLIDSLDLLKSSRSWTTQDQQQMTAWLTEYANWLATSKQAADERKAANNHGTWFDTEEVSLLIYLGKKQQAHDICERAKARIGKQIEPDGHQPLEEARADGFGYSVFNLEALCLLATLSDRVDVDLWHFQAPDGRGIRKVMEYLAPYADPDKKWPHNQLNPPKATALVPALSWAVAIYGDDAFGPALRKLPPDEVARNRVRLMTGK